MRMSLHRETIVQMGEEEILDHGEAPRGVYWRVGFVYHAFFASQGRSRKVKPEIKPL